MEEAGAPVLDGEQVGERVVRQRRNSGQGEEEEHERARSDDRRLSSDARAG
jgi:hypothetical protein